MKTKITSGEKWKSEDEFFSARRRDQRLEIIERSWSGGSSSIMMVKWGCIEREAWEKCFWIKHPSSARCFECKNSVVCPSYIS